MPKSDDAEIEIQPLTLLRLSDAQEFGGKAATLGELACRGLPIAPGVAISGATYRKVAASPTIRRLIDQFWSAANGTSSRRHLSDSIRNELERADIRALIAVAVKALHRQGLAGAVLVRSSATQEDGPARSFAGQFVSRQATVSSRSLRSALLDVWASATQPHVRQYQERWEGGDPGTLLMGALIQPFYTFEISGIAFTRHPITPVRGWGLVEFSDGPTSAIVGGEITPHRVRLRLESGAVLVEHTGATDVALPRDLAAQLARYMVQIREVLATECDIEWGVFEGAMLILQARPDTSFT